MFVFFRVLSLSISPMLQTNATKFSFHSFIIVLSVGRMVQNGRIKESQTSTADKMPFMPVAFNNLANTLSSLLFYFRLCPSTAGSSPPPESHFLCTLPSLSVPWCPTMASLQRRFGFQIDHTPFICHSVLPMVHLSLQFSITSFSDKKRE